MKTPLPTSGALATATSLPAASVMGEDVKRRVWFTIKHEHRGIQYKKNQEALLTNSDIQKLEKLGKITTTEPVKEDPAKD